MKRFSKFLILSFVCVLPFITDAATLSISPASGSYKKGTSFTVNVLVTSQDQAMNAASGFISFPADLLSVTSISKAGSIVNLWAQEPSFSNTSGNVVFESVLLPPGFMGSAGKLISITFRAKSEGTANLSFTAGAVLAHDGIGTDILTYSGGATFEITSSGPSLPPPPVPVSTVPKAPIINSPTHPDPNSWYPLRDANFSWILTKDITKSSVLFDRKTDSSPVVSFSPATDSTSEKGLSEGASYLHVQLKNNNGWGAISHFRVQVDTEKPTSFNITEIKRVDDTDPRAKFVFDASDKTSGIDHYEIQIDKDGVSVWRDDGSHQYITVPLSPGKHSLDVKAVDKAGNWISNSIEFSVGGLNSPIITDYPKRLNTDEYLIVKGSTYPDSKVTMYLEKESGTSKSSVISSDQSGKFSYTSEERLSDGIYKIFAEVTNVQGAKSLSSEKLTIVVSKSFITRAGTFISSVLSKIVPIILILALILVVWYLWRRFFIMYKKKAKKEVHGMEFAVHKAFESLKDDVREQIKMLEKARTKRQLTDEEEKIIRQLKRDIDDAERFIRKEIEGVEKRMK